jgi:curved DNA-binding protein CbpA
MHLLTFAYLAVIIVSTSSFRVPLLFRGIIGLDVDLKTSSSNRRRLKESNFCHLLKEHRGFSIVTSRLMTAADMDWDPKSAPKLDFNEDFYSILEVDPEIKGKELKKAYYKIVFKYHPDNKEGKEQKDLCNKQMMVINAAYKILKDEDARVAYDRKRRMGVYGEAAKVGKSSGGSSNSRSQTQTQTQQTQRSTSSYTSSSSSDPFSGYYRKEPEDSGSTESLGDIFSDFWSEIRKGETKNLVVDLLDFLEDQVRACIADFPGPPDRLQFDLDPSRTVNS